MKLTIRKCDGFGDWYVIERAEHDGREWLAPTGYGSRFMRSARISDADVEGTGCEMHAIAGAIEARGSFHARRCAVWLEEGGFRFESPRNSSEPGGLVTMEHADELARLIRAEVNRGE